MTKNQSGVKWKSWSTNELTKERCGGVCKSGLKKDVTTT